jgi:hypothetical protein
MLRFESQLSDINFLLIRDQPLVKGVLVFIELYYLKQLDILHLGTGLN